MQDSLLHGATRGEKIEIEKAKEAAPFPIQVAARLKWVSLLNCFGRNMLILSE
jgi:hypothetical protein